MADILGQEQAAYEAESRRLDRQEQAMMDRLQRQKLMLQLLRAGEKLKPEDARDIARAGDLTVEESSRLLASTYGMEAFPQVFSHWSQAQMEKERQHGRYELQDLRNLLSRTAKEHQRELQTPSEEEYNQLYVPRYAEYGITPPPYGGRTYQEIEAELQHRKPKTTSAGGGSSGLDRPVNPDVVQEVANVLGRPVPPGSENWTYREFNAWKTAKAPAGPKELTPGQKITSVDEVKNHLYDLLGEGMDVDKQTAQLISNIASRAISQGGDVLANAEEMLRKMNVTKKTKKGRREALADSLSTAPRPEDARRKIEAILDGGR